LEKGVGEAEGSSTPKADRQEDGRREKKVR